MKELYKADWSQWLEGSERQRREAAAPPLETLRERVAELQTTRETERAHLARKALDRRAFEASDTARAMSAQARLEAMVGAWEADNQANSDARQKKEAAAQNFEAHWTPRVSPPQAPDQFQLEALRSARIETQGVLRAAWEGQRGEQAVAAQVDTARDKAFLRKWVGLDKNPELTEDNMYIWRDPALGTGEDEGGADDEGNGSGDSGGAGGSSTTVVAAKLTIDLDFAATCADPEAKAAFEAAFVADMARQLGCDPSMLQVTGLEPGSVVVNFQIESNTGDSGAADPKDLLADLRAAVGAGGFVVAGGGATKMVETTPSKDKAAKHQQKIAQKRAYKQNVQENVLLMEYRQAQKGAAAAQELAQELERGAAEAEGLQAEGREQLRRREEERTAARAVWEAQKALAAERAAAKKVRADAVSALPPELIWQRAEEELERRRVASTKLKADVQAGLAAQLTARQDEQRKARETTEAERAAFAEEQQQLERLARMQQETKREQEQAARMEIWRQIVEAREVKAAASVLDAEEERGRARAAAENEARVASMLPATSRAPKEARPAGMRRHPWHVEKPHSTPGDSSGKEWFQHQAPPTPPPPPPQQHRHYQQQQQYDLHRQEPVGSRGSHSEHVSTEGFEREPNSGSFAAEWSRELDRAFQAQLAPRAASTMSFLKNKFMAAATLGAAREVERRVRHECAAMEGNGVNALRHMEPAFLNPQAYCKALWAVSTPELDSSESAVAAVPKLDFALLNIVAPNDTHFPPSTGQYTGAAPYSSASKSTINLAWS